MSLRLNRYAGAAQFLAVAEPFLVAREAEHSLMLGLAAALRRQPDRYGGPPLLATVADGTRLVAAAVRTPPNNLLLSEVDDRVAIPLLADLLHPDQPGISGPPDAVRVLAEHRVQRFGGRWKVHLDERIYRLSVLIPPRRAAGRFRLAVSGDRSLLQAWLAEFVRETFHEEEDPAAVRRRLDDWESAGGRRFWLWEDDGGTPASLVGAGGQTPNGMRIGPVYTPPDRRGRGYASNLTAAVTDALLAEGRRFCFLYTDAANPTSNRIYQAIGYEPVADALMVRFGAG